jgi:hypothetical protein
MHSNIREGGRRGREKKEERRETHLEIHSRGQGKREIKEEKRETHLEIHSRGQGKREIQTRRDISTANATATRVEEVREILAAIGLLKLAET